MNKTLLTALALLPGLSFAATLKLADDVYVHQADNTKVANYLWKKTDTLELAPGSHRLKTSYKTLVEDGFESHTKFSSDEIWVELTIPAEGQYLLTTPRLDGIDAIRDFAKAPRFVLQQQGKALATAAPSQAPAIKAEPVITQVIPPVTTTAAVTKPNAQAAPAKPMPQAEQMLKYWWQQADQQTRENFKAWTEQQP